MRRVSRSFPSRANCLKKRVPKGKRQWSMSLVSIWVPGGSAMKRRFSAPSDQSTDAGANSTTAGEIVFVAMSS
ncbi:MAG: hypothetical protein U0235_09145 [Polyangiaceae bacterium]